MVLAARGLIRVETFDRRSHWSTHAGAIAGTLLGAAVAVCLLDGLAVRFSMGVFGVVVDPTVLAAGLLAGLLLGLVGGLPPAWRCLKLPIAEALKAT